MAEAENRGFFTPPTAADPLQNKKKSKSVLLWILILFLILGALGAGGYYALKRFINRDASVREEAAPFSVLTGEDAPGKITEEEGGRTLGQAKFSSENFKIGDIAIAGESEFLLTEDTIDPLVISAIRGDSFTEKNSQEVRLIVSWRTNKLAKSEISYSKGIGQPEENIKESQYGLTHSLVIPNLAHSTTYVYTVTAIDRFGNIATSDAHAIYTGTRGASLFDLIADAIGEIFGWAVNKK